jgi:hypothetical protein
VSNSSQPSSLQQPPAAPAEPVKAKPPVPEPFVEVKLPPEPPAPEPAPAPVAEERPPTPAPEPIAQAARPPTPAAELPVEGPTSTTTWRDTILDLTATCVSVVAQQVIPLAAIYYLAPERLSENRDIRPWNNDSTCHPSEEFRSFDTCPIGSDPSTFFPGVSALPYIASAVLVLCTGRSPS